MVSENIGDEDTRPFGRFQKQRHTNLYTPCPKRIMFRLMCPESGLQYPGSTELRCGKKRHYTPTVIDPVVAVGQ